MHIYGTAILSVCLVLGLIVGSALGKLMGVDKNIGGVGIAMLLLIVASDYLRKRGRLPLPTEQGIQFWSAIYIPIVVAMAASQDVIKAVAGGWLALTAGVASVLVCFALVPVLSRIGKDAERTEQGNA